MNGELCAGVRQWLSVLGIWRDDAMTSAKVAEYIGHPHCVYVYCAEKSVHVYDLLRHADVYRVSQAAGL